MPGAIVKVEFHRPGANLGGQSWIPVHSLDRFLEPELISSVDSLLPVSFDASPDFLG